jgi:hypothetical protein
MPRNAESGTGAEMVERHYPHILRKEGKSFKLPGDLFFRTMPTQLIFVERFPAFVAQYRYMMPHHIQLFSLPAIIFKTTTDPNPLEEPLASGPASGSF